MLNIAKLKQHSTKRHFIITKVHFLSNELLQNYLTCCPEVAQYHKKKRHLCTHMHNQTFSTVINTLFGVFFGTISCFHLYSHIATESGASLSP